MAEACSRLGEGQMRFRLIPIGCRTNIVLQGQIAPSGAPADGLHGHPQILMKADGSVIMEAVHIVPVAGNVGLPVIFRLQVTITEKGRAEILAEAP